MRTSKSGNRTMHVDAQIVEYAKRIVIFVHGIPVNVWPGRNPETHTKLKELLDKEDAREAALEQSLEESAEADQ